jgi:epoxyqueuosine reductase
LRRYKKIPEGAASIIVALFPYYLGEANYKGLNVSRYAVAGDYHTIVENRLNSAIKELLSAYPAERFAAFTDNSPVPEVRAAIKAGLGVIGENNLLIHPDYGSWVFIGEIVTTLKVKTSKTGGIHNCKGCGRCVAACPAGILGRLKFDKTACLSHITQSKGELTPEQTKLIKASGCAWGCDICQLVCPMNNAAKITPIDEFTVNLRPKVKLGDDINGRAYAWRGRAVIERNIILLSE